MQWSPYDASCPTNLDMIALQDTVAHNDGFP